MNVLYIDQIAKVNYVNTFSLSEGLLKKNIKLTLAIDKQEVRPGELVGAEVHHLFITDEKNIGKISKFKNYINAFHQIEEIIVNNNIDVLHIQWIIFSPLDYFLLNKIKKKYKIRLVDTIHDILPFNEHFYDKHFHRKIYELDDAIIVQAQGNVDRFNKLFPECSDKVHLVPLGNWNAYVEEGNGQRLKDKFGIEDSDFVLLFIGQIKKVKGIDVLLKAFQEVAPKHSDMKLIIAGNPWKDDVDEYQPLIESFKNSNQLITDFRFIPDEELADYYAVADLVVLPYTDVYQSGVIRLTYSHKKPVIATKLPAFMEIVEDGVNGFLCEAGDAESLADAMERAYLVREKLPEMGSRGFEVMDEKYSIEMIVDKVYELYE